MDKTLYGFYGICIVSISTIISANVIIIIGIVYDKSNLILIGSNLLTAILALWIRSPRFKIQHKIQHKIHKISQQNSISEIIEL